MLLLVIAKSVLLEHDDLVSADPDADASGRCAKERCAVVAEVPAFLQEEIASLRAIAGMRARSVVTGDAAAVTKGDDQQIVLLGVECKVPRRRDAMDWVDAKPSLPANRASELTQAHAPSAERAGSARRTNRARSPVSHTGERPSKN